MRPHDPGDGWPRRLLGHPARVSARKGRDVRSGFIDWNWFDSWTNGQMYFT